MSISFPVGSSTSLEDKYSKLPDNFQVSPQRKMMINPSTRQASPLSSGPTGASRNCNTSSSRFINPVQAPSVSPHERRSQNSSHFVPQSTVGRPSFMESQSGVFIDPMEDNKEISWGQDSLQDLLDFPVMEPIQSVPVEDSRLALAPVNHPEKNVWTEWDPLISIEGDLDQYWPDLPVTSSNGNVMDSKSEGITQSINAVAQQPPQNYQHQPAQSGEFSSGPDPSSAAAPTKSRMRWTQELHEAFVESVSKLGGSERATPKGILTLMKVSGLTIYHVKSHLQKYRTARFKPELSEGNSETKSTLCEEVKSEEVKTSIGITEALRLQVELQKRLHEQLETQRKLQLQIEEQGKYLQKMFEQHKTMGNKFNKSDGHEREPSSPSSDSVHKSSQNGKTAHPKAGIDAAIALNESSRDATTTKHKAQESDTSDSDSPATKRARSG